MSRHSSAVKVVAARIVLGESDQWWFCEDGMVHRERFVAPDITEAFCRDGEVNQGATQIWIALLVENHQLSPETLEENLCPDCAMWAL